MSWRYGLMVVGALFTALFVYVANAQSRVIADQGKPGNQGPWPVTGSVTIGDGGAQTVVVDGGNIQTTPQTCTTTSHKATSVGLAAGSTPSTQLTNRRYIILCNSLQNSGSPLVKCRVDGVTPVMALGNPGDVLGIGDCILYPIAAGTVPSCIADKASTSVDSFECL